MNDLDDKNIFYKESEREISLHFKDGIDPRIFIETIEKMDQERHCF